MPSGSPMASRRKGNLEVGMWHVASGSKLDQMMMNWFVLVFV